MDNVIIPILVSLITSGIVSFTLKTIIKSTIEHKYTTEIENLKAQHSLEIENLKADLSIKTNKELELTNRRLSAYPKLVEIVYRIRNMSRDLNKHISISNISLITELSSRTKDLEEKLYEYSIDLESDNLFLDVHKYKNVVFNFCMKSSDIKYFIEHNETERLHHSQIELETIYEEIESLHKKVIASLTSMENV
jgi:hypothetical protein